jgi:GNAT superfamily N-acetyltransferase
MPISQSLIDYAAQMISKIDSGEANVFLEAVNTDKQVEMKIFEKDKPVGVFFSCEIYGGLRASLALAEDTDEFNEETAELIERSIRKSALALGSLWIRNENRIVIEYLKERFHTRPEGRHYYASVEFIQRRAHFNPAGRLVPIPNFKIQNCSPKQSELSSSVPPEHAVLPPTPVTGKDFPVQPKESALTARPYDEKYIDKYLNLLDGSMIFTDTPMNYRGNKTHYLNLFKERAAKNSFEAFWKDDELIGLYWRDNFEIDTLAVNKTHQRKGYGTDILTRAIQSVFDHTDSDFARLYAVDWNEKARMFYTKYGMEASGHSYLLKML